MVHPDRGLQWHRRSSTMSQPAPATDTTRSAEPASDVPQPGPRGRWLLVARSLWLLLACGLLADVILCIPTLYRLQYMICTRAPAECSSLNLPTLHTVRALHQLGLSLPTYAIYATLVALVLPLGYCSVGTLIFWRKSAEWL